MSVNQNTGEKQRKYHMKLGKYLLTKYLKDYIGVSFKEHETKKSNYHLKLDIMTMKVSEDFIGERIEMWMS